MKILELLAMDRSSWAGVDVQSDVMPQVSSSEPKSSPRQRETREFHPLLTIVDKNAKVRASEYPEPRLCFLLRLPC